MDIDKFRKRLQKLVDDKVITKIQIDKKGRGSSLNKFLKGANTSIKKLKEWEEKIKSIVPVEIEKSVVNHEIDIRSIVPVEIEKSVVNHEIDQSSTKNFLVDKSVIRRLEYLEENEKKSKVEIEDLKEELNKAKVEIDSLRKILAPVQKKRSIRILGFSVYQRPNGSWQASGYINGKTRGVFIGKNLSDAEARIQKKLHEWIK